MRFFYLLLLFTVFSMSCSKEDDPIEPVIPDEPDTTDTLEIPQIPHVVSHALVVDPTKISPLTAMLSVKTDIETKVTVLIKGQDGVDLSHDFNKFGYSHVVPILGLYLGCENEVIVTLTSKSSGEVKMIEKIKTDSLTWLEIKKFEPIMPDSAKVGNRFVMLHLMGTNGLAGRLGCCPVMIDKFGKIRWVYNGDINHVFKKLSNGRYLIDGVGTGFSEIDLLGVKHGYWAVPEGIHHDAVETLDNSILFLSHAEGSTDDGVMELSLQNGSYLNKWDLRKILDPNRPQAPKDGADEDWLHLNGIDYQKKDNSFILSGRNQSAVIKVDRKSGNLKWILGNHEHWNDSLKRYLLTPKGNDFEWQWGQHAPVFNPKDPSKILLFDNGCARSYSDPIPAAQNYSRVVEYKVDETAMTVEQMWQFGKEYGSELYSTYISNVRYLENGHILICYGGLTKNPAGEAVDFGALDICNSVRILEIIPSTKEVVWDLKLEGKDDKMLGYRSYRAYEVDIYN